MEVRTDSKTFFLKIPFILPILVLSSSYLYSHHIPVWYFLTHQFHDEVKLGAEVRFKPQVVLKHNHVLITLLYHVLPNKVVAQKTSNLTHCHRPAKKGGNFIVCQGRLFSPVMLCIQGR